MTFTQNYINGWGYAYLASWSLALEEHFYFGFSLLLSFGLSQNKIVLIKGSQHQKYGSFEMRIITVMILCLLFRLFSNTVFPNYYAKNFTMTHLRIDSLLAGVLIAYLYYFRIDFLRKTYSKYKYLLLASAIVFLIWTPFIDTLPSFFVKTLGFTLLYISFGILLLYFILEPDINHQLNRAFSSPIVNLVSEVGYCSYSIYIIHSFVNDRFNEIIVNWNLHSNHYFSFFLTSTFSIGIGIFMTYKIEKYFLSLRDRFFPNRA